MPHTLCLRKEYILSYCGNNFTGPSVRSCVYLRIRSDQFKLRLATHSGNLTPPRISPSRSLCLKAEAEQGYHCRQRRSWRDSLPGLLWDGLNRWAPYCRSFDAGARLCTGGLGAPSESLISLLKLFSCRIWLFQGTVRRVLKTPSIMGRDKIKVFHNLSIQIFLFSFLRLAPAWKQPAARCAEAPQLPAGRAGSRNDTKGSAAVGCLDC